MTSKWNYFLGVLISLVSGAVCAQQELYEYSPEFIRKHGIKRIVIRTKTAYHDEKGLPPDSSRIYEFDRNGLTVYSTGFLKNKRYFWTEYTYDNQQRMLKSERFNEDQLHDYVHYEYLPNCNYIVRSFNVENSNSTSYYACFLDENGNVVERQEIRQDSIIMNRDLQTYTEQNLMKSRLHLGFRGDTVIYERYTYKDDTLLVRKDLFNSRGEHTRTRYEYLANGKEKVVHYGDQSSWYSFYDDKDQLIKRAIVRHDQKDTLYNVYAYNERGLMTNLKNLRENMPNRREVYTYENGREKTKEVYARANTFNSLMETEYLGDTAKLIYITSYWEKQPTWLDYQRFDSLGNITEKFRSEVKGLKRSVKAMREKADVKQYAYRYSSTGKVLAKYQVVSGWLAESAFCSTYVIDDLTEDFGRRPKRQKYYTCDTVRVRRHKGGKHYFVSINGKPNLMRHVYQNKAGEIDSVLDINKSGVVLNRMVKENGLQKTYFLKERFEYNKMDSLLKVYDVHGCEYWTTDENVVEEHFWKDGRKVKLEKYTNYWGQYSSRDTTTILFDYQGRDVFRTTTNPQGNIIEERYRYDGNGRLVEILNMDRLSSGNIQTKFTYDENGNLLERAEVAIMNSVETILEYEYF